MRRTTSNQRRILMVVANLAVSTTTGWPVGFWASELNHPYDAFVRHGYEVVIASPNGGKVELDAYSDPRDANVKGRKMTGFANSEEDFADKAVGQKLMPFRIEDEANKLGAQFTAKPAFQPHPVRDGNLITGQQQHSGGEVANLVISALEGGGK